MVYGAYATFNNISVISWQSVLLVEEKTTELPQVTDLSHDLVWMAFQLTMLVVIVTDCIGNNKSNYHTITTMMAPLEYKCCIHTKRKNQNTVSTIDSKDEDDFREGNSY